MHKPKIVFLSRYQGVSNRGVERVVKVLAEKLADDFEVDILVGKSADSWSKVRAGRYDLVIPTNGRWQALKMSWGRWIGRYKVIITGHSGLGIDDLWNLVVVRPNVFVGLTAATLKNWKMRLGKLLAVGVRVVQIPNGIDRSVFTGKGVKKDFGLAHPIILSVGALVPEKRHDLAIKAMARLEQGSLVIVGDGLEKAALERLGQQLLPGRFQIIKAEFDELPAIYRGVDLFTLPSWEREAFGVVYLEAMASGLGVVAPNDQARREIVGHAGILVEVTDEVRYAAAIKQALAKDWRVLALAQVEKYDWQEVAGRYRALILKLIR